MTVASWPCIVSVPLHDWVMRVPEASVKLAVQVVTADVVGLLTTRV